MADLDGGENKEVEEEAQQQQQAMYVVYPQQNGDFSHFYQNYPNYHQQLYSHLSTMGAQILPMSSAGSGDALPLQRPASIRSSSQGDVMQTTFGSFGANMYAGPMTQQMNNGHIQDIIPQPVMVSMSAGQYAQLGPSGAYSTPQQYHDVNHAQHQHSGGGTINANSAVCLVCQQPTPVASAARGVHVRALLLCSCYRLTCGDEHTRPAPDARRISAKSCRSCRFWLESGIKKMEALAKNVNISIQDLLSAQSRFWSDMADERARLGQPSITEEDYRPILGTPNNIDDSRARSLRKPLIDFVKKQLNQSVVVDFHARFMSISPHHQQTLISHHHQQQQQISSQSPPPPPPPPVPAVLPVLVGNDPRVLMSVHPGNVEETSAHHHPQSREDDIANDSDAPLLSDVAVSENAFNCDQASGSDTPRVTVEEENQIAPSAA